MLYRDKPRSIRKPKKVFAWFPVWAFEGDLLHLVWLEWVMRTSFRSGGKKYLLIKKKNSKEER